MAAAENACDAKSPTLLSALAFEGMPLANLVNLKLFETMQEKAMFLETLFNDPEHEAAEQAKGVCTSSPPELSEPSVYPKNDLQTQCNLLTPLMSLQLCGTPMSSPLTTPPTTPPAAPATHATPFQTESSPKKSSPGVANIIAKTRTAGKPRSRSRTNKSDEEPPKKRGRKPHAAKRSVNGGPAGDNDKARYQAYLQRGRVVVCEIGAHEVALKERIKYCLDDGKYLLLERWRGCHNEDRAKGNHCQSICHICEAIFINNFKCEHLAKADWIKGMKTAEP